MRKGLICLCVAALVGMAGCVTINVYFPEAAAQKAADQFVGSVIGDATPAAATSSGKPAPAGSSQPPPAMPGTDPTAAVLDFLVPAAHAANKPDLRVQTPAVEALHRRMRTRYHDQMKALLNKGVVGFTQDGLVAVRSASSVPLSRRSQVQSTVAAENRDRKALYSEIASANNHPEWASRIQQTFARIWIQKAHAGWYVQNANGTWHKK